ncbi:MAG: 16S rRNA (cytidine(1402)-2'-O)-methyltransferase [Actinobacteria bacterium]|nr:16S rRNA (cytidine(1402)-2'-O)-methyltransferase [Actinomycetota bacterium]
MTARSGPQIPGQGPGSADQNGGLMVVGTPIGNLGDLSPRAVEALRTADIICCEDTRRTRKLLTHVAITGSRLVAVHEHNEAQQAERVVEWVRDGKSVALVSDAGMPAVSDPGARVVAAVTAAHLPVDVVPGPSAVLAALVVSGLPTERFAFEGFLPRKGRERAARLAAIAGDDRTTVLYEAPQRVAATLADLAAACGGERRVAVARELTKLHEEVRRGTLADIDVGEPRGEYVIVLDGAPPRAPATPADVEAALRHRLDAGDDKKAAVAAVAAELGVPKRDVYAAALTLR